MHAIVHVPVRRIVGHSYTRAEIQNLKIIGQYSSVQREFEDSRSYEYPATMSSASMLTSAFTPDILTSPHK
jgi:hypothetical protein